MSRDYHFFSFSQNASILTTYLIKVLTNSLLDLIIDSMCLKMNLKFSFIEIHNLSLISRYLNNDFIFKSQSKSVEF